MRLRLLHTMALLFVPSFLMAQSHGVQEDDTAFRMRMYKIVAEGNRQYELSNRAGIKAAVDELESALYFRKDAGLLNETDESELTADLCKLLGDWHYENSNYDDSSCRKAEECFNEALEIYLEGGDIYDLDKLPMIYRERAQLYYKCGLYKDAYKDLRAALSSFDKACRNRVFVPGDPLYYEWLDIQMQIAMCLARLGEADEALSIADKLVRMFEKGSEKYYETLRKKAKILMLSGRPGNAKQALPLYKSFYQWRKKDALAVLRDLTPSQRQDYWMRMRPFVTDCFQLEGEDPGFIFDVALFSKGLLLQLNAFDRNSDAIKILEYTWKDIQKSLPSDGCAIEYVQYEKSGRQKLGAVVVRKKGRPVWVSLMDPESFLEYKTDGRVNEHRLYSSSSSVKNALYQDDNLNELIWNSDLRRAIKDCRKIYFSPDGYVHQLAVEYMLPAALSGRKLYRLSSTRNLVAKRTPKLDSALIVGGLTYLSEVAAGPGGNDALAYIYLAESHAYFSHLPGTKEEAESIYAIRSCPGDSLIMGKAATEPGIRSLMGQYSIVNVSTHGFFDAAEVPQGTDLKPCLEDETLSRSSLALSGANKSLWDLSFDARNQDGILSAAEIATLDLSKVDLAVVSACQTALGRVTSDGVYGIQRGFKNAGVGAMVVSLWSVSDRATVLLMTRFHANLAAGMDIHDAFFAARQSLIDRTGPDMPSVKARRFNPRTMSVRYVSEEEEFSEPQYYNAFILIDAI